LLVTIDDMNLPAITNLRKEWEQISRTKRADALLADLLDSEPSLKATGARTWAEVLQGGAVGQYRQVDSWHVTSALLRQFHRDQLVGLALLVRLTPGLLAIARSLDWGRTPPWSDADALAADAISTTWEVLDRLAGASISYPERTLLRAVRQRLTKQRTVARRHATREEPTGHKVADFCDPKPIPVLDELAMALRLHQPRLPLRDLELIFQHRVLGLSFPELSALTGESACAIGQRSCRAEAALCA